MFEHSPDIIHSFFFICRNYSIFDILFPTINSCLDECDLLSCIHFDQVLFKNSFQYSVIEFELLSGPLNIHWLFRTRGTINSFGDMHSLCSFTPCV